MKTQTILNSILLCIFVAMGLSPARCQKQPDPLHPQSIGPVPPTGPTGPTKISIEDLLKQGQQQLAQGHADEAAKLFRQAVALKPNDYRGYENLAFADINLKQYDEAVFAASKATVLNENDPALFSLLSDSLLQQGKNDAARTAVNRAIQMSPAQVAAWMQLGRIELKAKNYREALRAFLTALGLAPDDIDIHASLGDTYEQLNQHNDALREYDAALLILNSSPQPRNPELDRVRIDFKMSRAVALAGLKRSDEAEAEARAALASSPKEVGAHSTLAQVLDTVGKHDEAISEYKTALMMTPNDATLWGNMGWAQFNAGKFSDAIESSRKALQLDGGLFYVRFNLGLIYAVQNQWMEAQKEYQAAIKGAAPADVEAGIGDVRDALVKQPEGSALKQALDLLISADRRAVGLVE